MARGTKASSSRSTSSQKASADKQAPAKRAASPREKSARRQPKEEVPQVPAKEPILTDTARRDIAGIVFAVVALALIIIIAIPSGGVITTALSNGLKLFLGIGAYLLPVVLLAIGACFIMRFEQERMPARVSIGLALIFVAILGILALFTPLSYGDTTVPSVLFAPAQLTARGGYVGAGIAFAGLSLLGLPVSLVILIGIIAIGLVIIGFSISKLKETVQAKRQERKEAQERQEAELSAMPAPPYQAVPPAASAARHPAMQDLTRPLKRSAQANMAPPTQRLDASEEPKASTRAAQTPALTRRLGRNHADDASTAPKTQKLDAAEAPANVSKDANGKPSVLAAPHPQEGFQLPSMDLLNVSKAVRKSKAQEDELSETAANLQRTLEDFGVGATVVDWVAGPTVTLFEVDLPPGVRVSKITSLNDDIALALAAPGVRIFAPVPGTHYVGIEVPNITRQNVLLGDVLKGVKGGPLQMAIGKDVEGKPVVCDLAKMPHLLIGGTTGSGKSVGINSMIMSMLMRATPAEVRFIMIDPKRVEFTPYNGIPHLYVPVVTEPKEAASALSWGVAEMERRLKVFSKVGARNIAQYNGKVQSGQIEDEGAEELPYIVIIIDELADLMMNVGKEVEFSISRIAQLARAAGIHLIVATQRPSANVVTGLIKANITNRMSFNVASSLDSRVILDVAGAESLIGNGDLLLSKPEYAKPRRIQGCYVSEEEIAAVVSSIKEQGEPDYHSEILKTNLITLGDSDPSGAGGSVSDDDPLLWDAAEIVVSSGLGSTSNIQRKLKVGYSRAGRIMDMLEEKGVVGPPNGSKPRDVLVDAMELESLKAFEQQDLAEGK